VTDTHEEPCRSFDDAAAAFRDEPLPADVDARLVAGIDALGRPGAPAHERRVPWGWVAALVAGLLVAALADQRRTPVATPRDPWLYRSTPLAPSELPTDGSADSRGDARGAFETEVPPH
jgi:hypothetical protein